MNDQFIQKDFLTEVVCLGQSRQAAVFTIMNQHTRSRNRSIAPHSFLNFSF